MGEQWTVQNSFRTQNKNVKKKLIIHPSMQINSSQVTWFNNPFQPLQVMPIQWAWGYQCHSLSTSFTIPYN